MEFKIAEAEVARQIRKRRLICKYKPSQILNGTDFHIKEFGPYSAHWQGFRTSHLQHWNILQALLPLETQQTQELVFNVMPFSSK